MTVEPTDINVSVGPCRRSRRIIYRLQRNINFVDRSRTGCLSISLLTDCPQTTIIFSYLGRCERTIRINGCASVSAIKPGNMSFHARQTTNTANNVQQTLSRALDACICHSASTGLGYWLRVLTAPWLSRLREVSSQAIICQQVLALCRRGCEKHNLL